MSENFTYQSHIISSNNQPKWIAARVSLDNLKSSSEGPLGPVTVRIDGNLTKMRLHAIQISNASIRSRIPSYLSHEGQPGKFYLDKYRMETGKYRRLVNELPDADKSRLYAICSFINNNEKSIV